MGLNLIDSRLYRLLDPTGKHVELTGYQLRQLYSNYWQTPTAEDTQVLIWLSAYGYKFV